MLKILNKKFHNWVYKYFYKPSFLQKLLAVFFLPLSFMYANIIKFKKFFSREIDFNIKIISVGNLILGGSGKTPLVKEIYKFCSPYMKTFIILRGYKRKSCGLIEVAINGKILTDIKNSGDEAMEYAISLKNANVIVSEDRILAIKKAKSMGAKLIIFDDGFSKFNIKKFDILLQPHKKPFFDFTIPSGAYRYPISFYKYANFIPDLNDVIKKSFIKNPTKDMVLVTAIANPNRLREYFDICKGVEIFPDHYDFNKKELLEILKKYQATSLLVTMKDYVKIKDYKINLSIIELNLTISPKFQDKILNFIK
ncbi:tetraacyldisaccharide 4'-kinase [Campylobacter portucalensis]|nr:tetraacyldisaccharide 4'-kinase [Campylobacter portucalensis]